MFPSNDVTLLFLIINKKLFTVCLYTDVVLLHDVTNTGFVFRHDLPQVFLVNTKQNYNKRMKPHNVSTSAEIFKYLYYLGQYICSVIWCEK